MRLPLLLLISCVFFSGTILFAQKAILTGTITDATSGETLLGVHIRAGNKGTTSDFEGKYRLELEAGPHSLEFSYVSYQRVVRKLDLKVGQELTLNLELQESETLLNTATVTSSKFEKPLSEVTVSLEVIRSDLLDNTNAISVNEVLDKLPGVNLLDDQVDIRGGAGYAQGTGSRVLLLMDDLPVLQVDAGLPQWRDLPTENIAQMEVLKGHEWDHQYSDCLPYFYAPH